MVRTRGPLLALEAHGQLARSIIYAKNRNHNYGGKYHIPNKNMTNAQFINRQKYLEACYLWAQLTAEQKADWATHQNNQQLSGFSNFISKYLFSISHTEHGNKLYDGTKWTGFLRTYTQKAAIKNNRGCTFSDPYVYMTTDLPPCYVIRLNYYDFTDLIYTKMDADVVTLQAIYYYDGYLYTLNSTAPCYILQIEAVTMKVVKKFPIPAAFTNPNTIAVDDTYIYISNNSIPASLMRLNRANLSDNTTYPFPVGYRQATRVLYDNTYIYVSLFTWPAVIRRCLKSNPATQSVINFPAVTIYCSDMCDDGTYLWVSHQGTASKFSRVLKSDISQVVQYTVSPDSKDITSIYYNNPYLFMGLRTDPIQVVKANHNTPTVQQNFSCTGSVGYFYRIVGNNYSIFASQYLAPCKIFKLWT